MDNLLYFRRQFLIANSVIKELQSWEHRLIGDLHIYAHPDLEVTQKDGPSASIILLGYIFDPAHPTKTNKEIVSDIITKTTTFEDLIRILKTYAGRYAMIYKDRAKFTILHDPLGTREIYYCTQPNRVICGSQPNFIDEFSEPKLGVTLDQNILDFYKNDIKLVRNGRLWVGEETYYQGVKHLMPNHYLDIRSLIANRYWPNIRLERIDLNEAVKLSCNYLKGVMNAVTSRYDVMMAVTSGIDSRSLLAASKEVKDKVYYFINKKPPLNDNSPDIRIPSNMFKKINVPFHVHEVEGLVDEEFRKVFLNNTFLSKDLMLPVIYNVYFKNHQNKVNLLGVGEIVRDYYGEAPNDLSGYYLAYCLKYKRSRYATTQCEKWLRGVREVAEECNVDIMKLFLWEMLLGNWGAVGNSESDIAIEEFDPYDSHYIYEVMLSVDPKYTKGAVPDLFKALYKEMWPELLEFPFNPPDTIRDRIVHFLTKIGIYKQLKKVKYRYDSWKFYR